jgi:hypothetical protein
MRSAIPIAAVLALALAPAAHAQVNCTEISRISKSALDGEFKDLTGKEIEDDLFNATYKLTGAAECTVEFSFDTVYACLWTYVTEADATTAYNAQVMAVGGCLPAWERRDDNDAGNFSDGLRYVRGFYFAGAGDESDLEWGVSMEEHRTATENDWHVWVELAYLW